MNQAMFLTPIKEIVSSSLMYDVDVECEALHWMLETSMYSTMYICLEWPWRRCFTSGFGNFDGNKIRRCLFLCFLTPARPRASGWSWYFPSLRCHLTSCWFSKYNWSRGGECVALLYVILWRIWFSYKNFPPKRTQVKVITRGSFPSTLLMMVMAYSSWVSGALSSWTYA